MATTTFGSTQYVVGSGSIEKLRDYQKEKNALVVDSNIMGALGLNRRIADDLLAGGACRVICDMTSEPTMAMLEEPIRAIRDYAPTRIIGVGGGAVMDTAKALWLFLEHPEYTWEQAFVVYGVAPFPGRAKLTVVPTTSGTGSETTGCAVLKDANNRKRLILSREIIPTEAIMDFDLLKSLPPKNIAYSGADALAHAMESALSVRSSAFVRSMACQAAVTLINELPASYGGCPDAREKVHVAASMAGMGIGNAGTGMAHGMDQAGGDFHLPHGLMTGIALPYTMQYLMPQPFYLEVARQLGIPGNEDERQKALIDAVFSLYQSISMPVTLREAGVAEQDYLPRIPDYVGRAMADANIASCPKNPTAEELERIFKAFYYGL